MALRKHRPSLTVTTSLNTVLASVVFFILSLSSVSYSSVSAEEGYIDNDRIVIDEIVYENTESDFSKIETEPAAGYSSMYYTPADPYYFNFPEDSSAYFGYRETIIPESGADGKIVMPAMLCYLPSHSECKGVHGLVTATAIGEPVTGTFYQYSSLWQKVSHGGITYYVPVDDIEYFEPLYTEHKPEETKEETASGQIEDNLDGNLTHTGDELKTCLWGIKNKNRGTDRYRRLTEWCEEHDVSEEYLLIKREEQMNNNLNGNYLNDTGNVLETCLWGLGEKEEDWDEYEYVIAWCIANGLSREIVEEAMERKGKEELISAPGQREIDGIYYAVTGYEKDDEVPLTFSLDKATVFDSFESDDSRNTYILIHGWISNSEAWADDMAETIKADDSTAQILLLDWRNIANQELMGGLPQAPGFVSRWTKPIVNQIHLSLTDWGIDSSKTTIIGHSLGSFIALKLSERLNGTESIIVLDPVAFGSDYFLEFGKEAEKMDSFNSKGACFVGDGSWLGSKTLLKTCREKYLINYNDPYGDSDISELIKSVVAEFTVDSSIQVAAKNIGNKVVRKVVRVLDSDVIVEAYAVVNGKQTLIGAAKAVFKGKLASLPCLAAAPAGLIAVETCHVVFRKAVEITADKIYKAAVLEHQWVHQTYDEIIRHPFDGVHLTPEDIASRIGSGNIFKADTVKEPHGTIYTEEDLSTFIKYLKVRTKDDPNRYTLYGNAMPNAFECVGKMECVSHGAGGADAFTVNEYSQDFTIADFKDNENDADKIIIRGNGSNTALRDVEYEELEKGIFKLTATCGDCILTEEQKETVYRNIYLEGVTLEEVDGWVTDANNEDGKFTENQLKKMPIYITN